VPSGIVRLYEQFVARWCSDDKHDTGDPDTTPAEQKLLTEYFGHDVVLPLCFFHHQLGGRPLHHLWANEVFRCPNPNCMGTLADRLRGRKRAMKFLAGVVNDPWAGLPMGEPANARTKKRWDYDVTVQYHICDCCWTVLGCNRYD
jgi:hypothetical protein